MTAHFYPLAMQAIASEAINLTTTTAGVFMAGLCTASAAAWTATQEDYQYVSDFTSAYTEVTSEGYSRVDISAGVTLTTTGNVTIWTCSSPIVFGSDITLTAACMFIYTTQVGSGDSSYPLISVVDFGTTISSYQGPWEYLVPASGLANWTEI